MIVLSRAELLLASSQRCRMERMLLQEYLCLLSLSFRLACARSTLVGFGKCPACVWALDAIIPECEGSSGSAALLIC